MGCVFLINNAAVSWRATRSPTVVLNACEAEVVSLSSACQEVVYLRKLCNELGFIQTSPLQYIKIVKALSPFEGKSILKSIQTHLTMTSFLYTISELNPRIYLSYLQNVFKSYSLKAKNTMTHPSKHTLHRHIRISTSTS